MMMSRSIRVVSFRYLKSNVIGILLNVIRILWKNPLVLSLVSFCILLNSIGLQLWLQNLIKGGGPLLQNFETHPCPTSTDGWESSPSPCNVLKHKIAWNWKGETDSSRQFKLFQETFGKWEKIGGRKRSENLFQFTTTKNQWRKMIRDVFFCIEVALHRNPLCCNPSAHWWPQQIDGLEQAHGCVAPPAALTLKRISSDIPKWAAYSRR